MLDEYSTNPITCMCVYMCAYTCVCVHLCAHVCVKKVCVCVLYLWCQQQGITEVTLMPSLSDCGLLRALSPEAVTGYRQELVHSLLPRSGVWQSKQPKPHGHPTLKVRCTWQIPIPHWIFYHSVSQIAAILVDRNDTISLCSSQFLSISGLIRPCAEASQSISWGFWMIDDQFLVL